MTKRKTTALFAGAVLWALQFGGVAPVAADGIDAGQPATVTCIGDCNGDGKVTIDEIIHGACFLVGACLELIGSDQPCPALDPYGTGTVDISVLLVAINNALAGCPQSRPTSTGPGSR
jgi:hypothetical protein